MSLRFILFLVITSAFISFISPKINFRFATSFNFSAAERDTILGNNTYLNGSSTPFFDQSALILKSPLDGKIDSISLRYQTITNINMNSSRLFLSTKKSISCLGETSPNGGSIYTIGTSEFLFPLAQSWNTYVFTLPIDVKKDSSYYIWPDAVQQINHNLNWADFPYSSDIGAFFSSTCSFTSGTNDYAALIYFIFEDCQSVLNINNTNCIDYYAQDTINSIALINVSDSVNYNSGKVINLNFPLEVRSNGILSLFINNGCMVN